MLSKILLTLLTIALIGTVHAEEAKEAPKADPKLVPNLILAYHGEFYFEHNDTNHELEQFSWMHNPTLGYKLTKNLKLTTTYEFKYADYEKAGFTYNRIYRALLSLGYSNLLNEKDHGIQLDVGLGRRYFDHKSVPSTYGNSRVNATVTKNWGDNNASVFFQYLLNDPKTIKNTTWKHGIEITPSINLQLTKNLSYTLIDDININSYWYKNNPHDWTVSHEFNFAVFTYRFSDLVSSYLQLKYNHTEDGTNEAWENNDDFDYYVGATFNVYKNTTLTAEIGREVFIGHDGKTIQENFKYPNFALYLDWAY